MASLPAEALGRSAYTVWVENYEETTGFLYLNDNGRACGIGSLFIDGETVDLQINTEDWENNYICDRCGESFPSADDLYYFEGDDSYYCEDCYEELVKCCDNCGNSYHRDTMEYVYNENNRYVLWCEGCREDYATECEHCGDLYDSAAIIETEDGYFYCKDCAKELGYVQCDRCGEWRHESDSIPAYDSVDAQVELCEDCANSDRSYHFRCEKCGRGFLREEGELEDSQFYCNECLEDDEKEEETERMVKIG